MLEIVSPFNRRMWDRILAMLFNIFSQRISYSNANRSRRISYRLGMCRDERILKAFILPYQIDPSRHWVHIPFTCNTIWSSTISTLSTSLVILKSNLCIAEVLLLEVVSHLTVECETVYCQCCITFSPREYHIQSFPWLACL